MLCSFPKACGTKNYSHRIKRHVLSTLKMLCFLVRSSNAWYKRSSMFETFKGENVWEILVKPTISEKTYNRKMTRWSNCKEKANMRTRSSDDRWVFVLPNNEHTYHSDHLMRLRFDFFARVESVSNMLRENIVQTRWFSLHSILVGTLVLVQWLCITWTQLN